MVNFIGSSSAFEQHMGSHVLEEIEELLPEIIRLAPEIERARALPEDLNRKLGKAGAFRMMLPKSVGGEGLHPLAALRVLETVAYADVSTAWTLLVAYGFNMVLGKFSPEVTGKLFANGPDVLFRGALAPQGTVTRKDGGYVLSGRWTLSSANYDYSWIASGALLMENGSPRMLASGMPDMRACLTPADSATYLDTWDSVGLCGSSSHDYVIKEVFVPESMAVNLFENVSGWTDPPLHRMPFEIITGPTHSAVCLGAAQAALDDLLAIGRTKKPAFNKLKLAEDPVFTYRLGELAGRLAIIRDGVYSDQLRIYDLANSERAPCAADTSKTAVVTSFAHKECMSIIEECLELSGSTGVYRKSPLQRRWRDVRAVCAHAGGRGLAATRNQLLGAALL
jgi:alkylation response protein AidB-like acyl-CoA dehydrogenase